MGLTVAIHQPNYLPWLGYFKKIMAADVFVFLDDVQFSKNSYINRVRVLNGNQPKWLTTPVTVHLGDPICAVRPADEQWRKRHANILVSYYRGADCFEEVWPSLAELYDRVPQSDLATINAFLVTAVAGKLGLATRFMTASSVDNAEATGDDRLIGLIRAIAPDGVYLSGRGGAKYQDEQKFVDAGLGLRYLDFDHPRYPQGGDSFVEGLSILDPLFRLGWSETARLLQSTSA